MLLCSVTSGVGSKRLALARQQSEAIAPTWIYLNHFLLYADTVTPAEGVGTVGEFLGDWFIHKAMWSNKTTVKANAASLKKFYAFMAERGLVKPEELATLKQQIKDELPDWLAAVERYNDPDVDLLEDGWPI